MSRPFETTPGYPIFLALLVKTRTDLSVTQEELANRLGLPPELVAEFENGQRHLDFVRTREWCIALGVDFTAFVLGVEAAMNANYTETTATSNPQVEPRPLEGDDTDHLFREFDELEGGS